MEMSVENHKESSRTCTGTSWSPAHSKVDLVISLDEESVPDIDNEVVIFEPPVGSEAELPVTEECSVIQNDVEVIDIESGSKWENGCQPIQTNVEIIDVDLGTNDDNIGFRKESQSNVEIINIDVGESTSTSIDHVRDYDTSKSEVEIIDQGYKIEYDFSSTPYQITGSWKEFFPTNRLNFTRGCKWAPDGSCILTCSDDNILRIFNLPQQLWDPSEWANIAEMEAVVKISEGELIYDYCWYPLMNSTVPSTCCLASTSRNSTVHLWDGFTGDLRCSYRPFNHMDEIATPHSLGFDSDGQKLFCGFEKVIRIFNVDTPGRNFEERRLDKKSGQSGIISCFAFTPSDKNISATGSYQKTIGIYSEPSGELECLLMGQKGGVTQLQFSPDGTYLYSGGRKDPEILCWDLRNLGTVLYSLRRSCETNQRLYFDISSCGRYVVSGNQNGIVTFWDVTKEPKILNEDDFMVLEPIHFYMAHEDCVNGVSLHPTQPLLCTSSGQRKFPALLDDEDDPRMFSPKLDKWDNSLRLWWIGKSN